MNRACKTLTWQAKALSTVEMISSGPDELSSPESGAPSRTLAGFSSGGGGSVPGGIGSAFTLLRPEHSAIPVLVSIPHAGRAYPSALLAQMRDPARASLMLEDRHADLLGEAIARETGATLLIAEAPRAMLDLNRAPDDVDWSMIANAGRPEALHSHANRRARSGLGLIPRKLARMGEIWKQRIELSDLTEWIAAIHTPYHATLSRTLADLRGRWGAALLIDLHSMPPVSGHGFDLAAPHLVLGDRFGAACGAELSAFALAQLGHSRLVSHNLPYSGGYILDRHGAPKRGLHALQVEVCRSTYLDGNMREIGVRFAAIARELAGFVRTIAEEVVWLGRPQISQAAE